MTHTRGTTLFQVLKALSRRAAPGRAFARTHFGSRAGRCFRRPWQYFTRNRVAGYIGWVGNGNVGDEAMFLAFRRLFPRFECLLYDRHPVELRLHRARVASEPFYGFVALGGGTLFTYDCYYYQLDHAMSRGVPAVTFGTGVDDPALLRGEDPEGHGRRLDAFAALLKEAKLVTARGPRTARALEARGVKGVQVIGDPALSACAPSGAAGEPRVAISLTFRRGGDAPPPPGFHAAVAKAARYLADKGRRIEFVPMGRGDARLGRELLRDLPSDRVRLVRDRDPLAIAGRLAGCEMVIGERLHSVILASGSGVPCVSLAYRPKCHDFMESVGMERFCIEPKGLAADTLVGAADEIAASRDALSRQLVERCDAYRAAQVEAARQITAVAGAAELRQEQLRQEQLRQGQLRQGQPDRPARERSQRPRPPLSMDEGGA